MRQCGLYQRKRRSCSINFRFAIRKYFPGIDDQILWKRESCLRMVDGAQINTRQTDDRRPDTAVPGFSNLFLVGDSIAAPGAGGDVGNESVLVAYRRMTGRDI